MKFFNLLLCVLVLSACASPFYLNPQGYEIKSEHLDDAWATVSSYKYIPGPDGVCKSPHEFFSDGGGDCGDFAIALVYLLGPASSVLGIESGTGEHAIVEYKGNYIEPQLYGKYYLVSDLILLHKADYYDVMKMATVNGTKGL
jgi:hypothetical protein